MSDSRCSALHDTNGQSCERQKQHFASHRALYEQRATDLPGEDGASLNSVGRCTVLTTVACCVAVERASPTAILDSSGLTSAPGSSFAHRKEEARRQCGDEDMLGSRDNRHGQG